MTPLCFLIKFKYNLKYTQYFKILITKVNWLGNVDLIYFVFVFFQRFLLFFLQTNLATSVNEKLFLFNHKFFAQKNSIVKWNGIHLPPTQKIFSYTKSTYQNNLNQWIGTWLIKLNDPFNGLNLVSIKSIKIPGGSPCGMQSMRFFVIN